MLVSAGLKGEAGKQESPEGHMLEPSTQQPASVPLHGTAGQDAKQAGKAAEDDGNKEERRRPDTAA